MSVSMYDSLIESKKKEFDEIAKDVSNFLREKKKWCEIQYGVGLPTGINKIIKNEFINIHQLIDEYDYYKTKNEIEDLYSEINDIVKRIIYIVKDNYCIELECLISEEIPKIAERLEEVDFNNKYKDNKCKIIEELLRIATFGFFVIDEHEQRYKIEPLFSFVQNMGLAFVNEYNIIGINSITGGMNLMMLYGLIGVLKKFREYLNQIDVTYLPANIYKAIIEYMFNNELVQELIKNY